MAFEEKGKDNEYDEIYNDKQDKPKKDYSHLYDGSSRKKPKGCEACGGPYPLCKDGCSVFDD